MALLGNIFMNHILFDIYYKTGNVTIWCYKPHNKQEQNRPEMVSNSPRRPAEATYLGLIPQTVNEIQEVGGEQNLRTAFIRIPKISHSHFNTS